MKATIEEHLESGEIVGAKVTMENGIIRLFGIIPEQPQAGGVQKTLLEGRRESIHREEQPSNLAAGGRSGARSAE